MILWAVVVILQGVARTRPFLSAAQARRTALTRALGSERSPIAERAAFAEHFPDVARAMGQDGPGLEPLIQAWQDFHEQIIDETASPIRSTGRPDPLFRRAGPAQTVLIFWSNIMVGAGLILTFLGLIYVLTVAAQGMSSSGSDVAQAQVSLIALLTASAAKFCTSAGGLIASILLRFGDHELTKRVNSQTSGMCTLLERGLLYLPPQKLAAEQLEELRLQSRELKSFNTDLAFQISERMGAQFTAAMAPVADSLGALNASMASMTDGLREGLKGGAADAISAAASGELRALGQTLNALREQLEGLSGHVGSSGEDAARQIRAAGSDFREAAENIRSAFDRLSSDVNGLGMRMVEQGDLAAQAQSDALARIVDGLEAAQARSSAVISSAVSALESAGRHAASDLQEGLSVALKQGVAESQATFHHAVEESGQGLREAAKELGQAIGGAAETARLAGQLFQTSATNASRAAESMRGIVDTASEASTALTDASNSLSAATAPISQSTQATMLAAERIARAVEEARYANAEGVRQISSLSESLRETSGAAEQAWRDYRARFEGVDRALEGATRKLSEALGDSVGQFVGFAQKVDQELASAVSRLSGSLSMIEGYAEALDEFVHEMRTRPPEPGE